MKIEEAIEKAIEGGWNPTWCFSHFSGEEVIFGDSLMESENNPCHYIYLHKILLDPQFWQCLGKAMKWFGEWPDPTGEDYLVEGWKYHMIKFMIHLADGGTIESYFDTL